VSDIANLGHNVGDIDLATQIGDNLREKHPDLVKRAGELDGMEARAPLPLTNADDADKVSTAIRQCTEFLKAAESTRVEDKEPYLAGGRAVDGFFQKLIKGVQDTKAKLLRGRTVWDEQIEAEARRRAAEEAKKAREEAEALAAKARTDAQKDRAVQAETRAEEAYQATKVSAAELTRTRTDTGIVTSLRKEWRHEVVDPKKVPKKFMVPSDPLIRAAVKAATLPDGGNSLVDADGNSLVPGVRIYQHSMSQVR